MAQRRRATNYNTYGSVAYAPAYDGSAVRLPRQEEEVLRRPRSRERVRQEALTRAKVQVREAGQVAPFAVVGFLAVAALAALLLFSYVQVTVLNGEMVSLNSQMSTLEKDYATLSAQYEKTFDLAAIRGAANGTMTRPTSDQVIYIDLSEPDTVVVYGQKDKESGLSGALRSAGQLLDGIVEYFR